MHNLLAIFDASQEEHRQKWIQLWETWEQREIYAHPDYVTLYLKPHQRALAAIMVSNHGTVLYPFIYRDLTKEIYWESTFSSGADITTPYGYGGPFCWNVADKGALADKFWEEFSAWATEQYIVSEFIRFSLFSEYLLPYPGIKETRLKNIVRSLHETTETIWMNYKHKVRKNVNRAEANQVEVRIDEQGIHLDDFLGIYYNTMDRRSASENYYFSKAFFERLGRTLAGQYVYFYAVHGSKVVSTELVLVSAESVYSFLGGTDQQHFDLRPNDLLKHHIILWAKAHEKKHYVLGGGYRDGDGVYRYKVAFAPNGERQFYVGRRILHPELYDALVQNKRRITGHNPLPDQVFFPVYRG